jgi:hypothetical protein
MASEQEVGALIWVLILFSIFIDLLIVAGCLGLVIVAVRQCICRARLVRYVGGGTSANVGRRFGERKRGRRRL